MEKNVEEIGVSASFDVVDVIGDPRKFEKGAREESRDPCDVVGVRWKKMSKK
jgi:hypothetical protein